MQRVAVLSHVKASSVPPSMSSSGVRRIAWHGGKISSNKEEALQKFYLRKLRSGDQLTAQKMKAMQGTLGVKLDSDGRKNSKKLHTAHAKVTAGGKHTVLKTGRVLGPKIDSKQKSKKQSNKNGKQQITRQPKTVAKVTQKRTENLSISLEDKLDLPLDALVGEEEGKDTSGELEKRSEARVKE